VTLWAIVPVKPIRRGKSRLAKVLSESERADLNWRLLNHTLKVLCSVREIGRVLVVSRDPEALALARDFGAQTLQEEGDPKLNTALKRATLFLRQYTLRSLLILPVDLPLLSPDDIRLVIASDPGPPGVVIVPDRHHQGTNVLLVDPPGFLDYEYGPGSFERHCERARCLNARLKVVELPSLALDIDSPDDLDLIQKMNKDWKEVL
jgi:2-phospho-L-lactate/phosphoenolpyruvate guanylyltransferase